MAGYSATRRRREVQRVTAIVVCLTLIGVVAIAATVRVEHRAGALSVGGAVGSISTVAGTGTDEDTGDGGQASAASLSLQGRADSAEDASGNVYISTLTGIRKIATNGVITTISGLGPEGDGDGGPASEANLFGPGGMTIRNNILYFVEDYGYRVRSINLTTGIIDTVAGDISGSSLPEDGDGGPATAAYLRRPADVAFDAAGDLYISDYFGNRIRKVTMSTGIIDTFAGAGDYGTSGFSGDGGPATDAFFHYPHGLAIGPDGSVYVADVGNDRVRRIDPGGTISTYAGSGSSGTVGYPQVKDTLGDGGPANDADVALDPYGLAVDRAGTLFIADRINSRIRAVSASGTISTVAGGGFFAQHGDRGFAGDGGPATIARMQFPGGIGLTAAGDAMITDWSNNRLRVVKGIAAIAPQGGPLTAPQVKSPSVRHGAKHETKCGDPVSTATGELTHACPDLSVPGRGPGLNLEHSYSSFDAGVSGPLGYGWRHSYQMSLSQSGSTATITEENGAQVAFAQSGSNWIAPPRFTAALTQSGGNWIFKRLGRDRFTFNSAGRLTKIEDRNSKATTLTYNGSNQLTTVTDAANRSLTFTYASGRITSVSDPASRSVSFTYDGSGNLIDWTAANGGVTRYTYDGAHRMLTTLDPNQAGSSSPVPITNHYDAQGRIDWQKDQLNNQLTLAYAAGSTTTTDPNGNVMVERFVDGLLTSRTLGAGTPHEATWSYSHDPATLAPRVTVDPNGNVSFATYDASGNLLSSTDGLGRTSSASFNAFNDPLTTTDPSGVVTNYTYDANGNLLTTSTPLLNGSGQTIATRTTTLTRATSAHPGDVTSMTDPNGKTWSYVYDASGNLSSVTAPSTPENTNGNKTSWIYDTIGRPTIEVSPIGNVQTGWDFLTYSTQYTYNGLSQVLTATQLGLNQVTTNTYKPDGQLYTTTDPNNRTTGYGYDLAQRPTVTLRPNWSTLQNTYDANGNLTGQIDGNTKTTSYHYDPLNRVDWSKDPLLRQTSYSYDKAGNLTSLLAPNGGSGLTTALSYDAANQPKVITYSDGSTPNVTFGYDANGRRTTLVDGTGTTTTTWDSLSRPTSVAAPVTGTVSYAYDLAGNPTTITYPGNRPVARHYDNAGRMDWTEDWLSPANRTTFAYDKNSNLKTTTYPNTATANVTFDVGDQLSAITHKRNTTTIASFSYTRDTKGLLASVAPTGVTQANETYANTVLDQMQKVNGSTLYAYDAADNITQQLINVQTFDAANQMTQQCNFFVGCAALTYDQRGDRITRTPTGGATTTYGYDQASRLKTVTGGTTYTYNGDGLRTKKVVSGATSNFTWDTTSGLPMLLDDGARAYIYGPDGAPVEHVTGTTPTYYHHDQLGSTRLLTDTAGTVAKTYSFDPYGNLSGQSGSGATTPLRNTGQYTDDETGLQYLRARYYDPASGQFLTRDPINSITRSPYGYVDGNPLNLVDPRGLAPCVGGFPLRCDDIEAGLHRMRNLTARRGREVLQSLPDRVDWGHLNAYANAQQGLRNRLSEWSRWDCGDPPKGYWKLATQPIVSKRVVENAIQAEILKRGSSSWVKDFVDSIEPWHLVGVGAAVLGAVFGTLEEFLSPI